MRANIFTKQILNLVCIFSTINLCAQTCVFKDTAAFIDFGVENVNVRYNTGSLGNYHQVFSSCPDDGNYSYTSRTSDCFLGDWITLNEDHTPNDFNGRMMLVNASEIASVFFVSNITGLKPNTDYEFGVWLINVCKLNSGCSPLPPNINIILETASGVKLADFKTGRLAQSDNPSWKKYSGMFTTSADVSALRLKMINTTNGGCGNDFAMDDISFRECYPPPPPVEKPMPKIIPTEKKTAPPANDPVVKKETPNLNPVKEQIKVNKELPANDKTAEIKKISPIDQQNIPLPSVLVTRQNPIVKQIQTGDAEVQIELYDNGVVDGDTITIYHNNELIVSHQGLSEKPIRFSIKVDPTQPTHEIVMVADNLGSIPPNTSLMVVTANKKRYEVFISSSEQKNAKVIIRE